MRIKQHRKYTFDNEKTSLKSDRSNHFFGVTLHINMAKADSIPTHILPDVQFMASEQPIAFGGHAPSHRINFFALVWFLEDTREGHLIDFQSYLVKKNLVYLLGKHQVHAIPSRTLPKARVLVFSEEFFHQISEAELRQLFLPFENDGIEIPESMISPMEKLFSLIMLEYKGRAETNLLIAYTTALLLHLNRFGKHRLAATATVDTRMIKLFQLMENNFRKNRTNAFYASRIGLTPKRVNEILREKAGMTISQLLNQLVLLEAKRELFHGDYSVKEIAFTLGFKDQSYFARFFKKHTGHTPEQFREQAAQQLQ